MSEDYVQVQDGKCCMEAIIQATLIGFLQHGIDEIKKAEPQNAFKVCMSEKLRGRIGGGRGAVRENFIQAAKECKGVKGAAVDAETERRAKYWTDFYQGIIDDLEKLPPCNP